MSLRTRLVLLTLGTTTLYIELLGLSQDTILLVIVVADDVDLEAISILSARTYITWRWGEGWKLTHYQHGCLSWCTIHQTP